MVALAAVAAAVALAVAAAYAFYPAVCRRRVTRDETSSVLPGDDIVPRPSAGWTLAVTIAAPAVDVWPWLAPMARARGGDLVVDREDKRRALVFRQRLPNGATGSWSFVLRPLPRDATRLLFRRRSERRSRVDPITMPAHLFVDMGMLKDIARKAERRARVLSRPIVYT